MYLLRELIELGLERRLDVAHLEIAGLRRLSDLRRERRERVREGRTHVGELLVALVHALRLIDDLHARTHTIAC